MQLIDAICSRWISFNVPREKCNQHRITVMLFVFISAQTEGDTGYDYNESEYADVYDEEGTIPCTYCIYCTYHPLYLLYLPSLVPIVPIVPTIPCTYCIYCTYHPLYILYLLFLPSLVPIVPTIPCTYCTYCTCHPLYLLYLLYLPSLVPIVYFIYFKNIETCDFGRRRLVFIAIIYTH